MRWQTENNRFDLERLETAWEKRAQGWKSVLESSVVISRQDMGGWDGTHQSPSIIVQEYKTSQGLLSVLEDAH